MRALVGMLDVSVEPRWPIVKSHRLRTARRLGAIVVPGGQAAGATEANKATDEGKAEGKQG